MDMSFGLDPDVESGWVVLVIFMQAGFALVEMKFCRAKHAGHVVMTNFSIFGIVFIASSPPGYPVMFGALAAAFDRLQ